MIPNRKAAYYTLGCKLNFAETSTIARQLEASGVAKVGFEDRPDIYVINTCSVTDHANRKCRNIVQRAHRVNPEAKVIVIGCYAQLKPKEIAAIPGVDLVLGAQEKFNIPDFLETIETEEEARIVQQEIKVTRDFVPSFSIGDRTRSFLKVQDGCNYFCAFCTIPLARGRSRSANVEDTVAEARRIAESGIREIVLTGVNIGDFGTSHDESFLDLIKALDAVDGIDRFRISSIEPNLLTDDIIDHVAVSKKFVPHFHIPLQSGSDAILKSMRRRYLSGLYVDRVSAIKKLMPDACIGVDVIVGFPGETNEEYETTFNFLKDLPISYLHVFSYSERPNTTALRLDGVVSKEVRSERSKRLRILSEKKKRAFYETQVGKTSEVLFEDMDHEGKIEGFTRNYIRVSAPYDKDLANKVVRVELSSLDPDTIMNGSILNSVPA